MPWNGAYGKNLSFPPEKMHKYTAVPYYNDKLTVAYTQKIRVEGIGEGIFHCNEPKTTVRVHVRFHVQNDLYMTN